MHAGLLHLGLNSFALWQLAVEVESVMGGPTFLAIYLLSGLAGSTASFLTSDLVTVGASGAVLGLVGALGGYFLRNREIENSLRQLLFLAALTSFNLYLGTLPDASIDNAGHIGGLVAGLWLGYSMGPRFAVVKELDVADGAIEFPKVKNVRPGARMTIDLHGGAALDGPLLSCSAGGGHA